MKNPIVLDGYDNLWALLCPECGFNCTHIDAVAVTTNNGSSDGLIVHAEGEDSRSRVNARAIRPSDRVGELSYRRHAIVLKGYCESGHEFAFSFMQHKGVTFVSVQTWDVPSNENGLLTDGWPGYE